MDSFQNTVFTALSTRHAHFAEREGRVLLGFTRSADAEVTGLTPNAA